MKLEKLKKELLKIDSNISASEADDCIFLSGEVDDYNKVVKAGHLAVDKKRYLGVVNNIKVKAIKNLLQDISGNRIWISAKN